MSRSTVWLIDAHYQIFRAYYSMPDLRSSDGSPVGAVRGYAATLIRFLTRQAPTHVAAAFDHALTSFRNEIYPPYKLGRTEAPEGLEPQFSLCMAVTEGLGVTCYELEDYEADDVIATLCDRLVEQGADVMIVSPDKDLSTLVSKHVSMFDLKNEEACGPEGVKARMGVPPELVEDYLTLVGDSVDNIPGVKGIGPKTASALLNRFGSLDSIPPSVEHWTNIELRGAAKMAERLAQASREIELSRELVHMHRDLPLPVRIDGLRWNGARRSELEELFERLGIGSLLERVPRFGG